MTISFALSDTIDYIMRTEPATVATLVKHKIACVGCPIAPFHTLEDVCCEYGLESGAFLRELSGMIDAENENSGAISFGPKPCED